MPDFFSDTHCMGVSYIGNSAQMLSYFLPLVHGAEPCSACSATPIVVMPSPILPSSIMMTFWLGPWVCCVVTCKPALSVSRAATTPP